MICAIIIITNFQIVAADKENVSKGTLGELSIECQIALGLRVVCFNIANKHGN
ncbi:hypothetical protein PA25_08120 [Pseudoalteromonas sp. A25]|nr:hypothetical protein PA25_08120 [Pseudoalteromonas sp. A25]